MFMTINIFSMLLTEEILLISSLKNIGMGISLHLVQDG